MNINKFFMISSESFFSEKMFDNIADVNKSFDVLLDETASELTFSMPVPVDDASSLKVEDSVRLINVSSGTKGFVIQKYVNFSKHFETRPVSATFLSGILTLKFVKKRSDFFFEELNVVTDA